VPAVQGSQARLELLAGAAMTKRIFHMKSGSALIATMGLALAGCHESVEPLVFDDHSAVSALLQSAEIKLPAMLVSTASRSTNDGRALRQFKATLPRGWHSRLLIVSDRTSIVPLSDFGTERELGRLDEDSKVRRYLPPSGAYGVGASGEIGRLTGSLNIQSLGALYRILSSDTDFSTYRRIALSRAREHLLDLLRSIDPVEEWAEKSMALFANVCHGCPTGAAYVDILEEAESGEDWVVFVPAEYKSLLAEASIDDRTTAISYDPSKDPLAGILTELTILGESFPITWRLESAGER